MKGGVYSAIDSSYVVDWGYVMVNDKKNYDNKIDSTFFYIDNLHAGLNKLQFVIPPLGNVDTLINIEHNIEDINIYIQHKPCQFNAEEDIKKSKPKLLIYGGIVSRTNRFQEFFEREYEIEYYDFGCIPDAMDCIKFYNEKIFKYLDEKYGKKWRDSVRPDVEFLNYKR